MDEYGWREATKGEVDELVRRLDLVRVFHSVADVSLWYIRAEAEGCKSYMDCKPYARRWDLSYYEKPEEGYQINQKNVDALAGKEPK